MRLIREILLTGFDDSFGIGMDGKFGVMGLPNATIKLFNFSFDLNLLVRN